MKLNYEDYDQLTVVSVRGELNAEDIDPLRKLAEQRLGNDGRDFVVDLEHTDFIDSVGLETLLWLQDACAERLGQVRLACCGQNIEQILELTRLASRFDRHEDVDAAIKSLR